MFARPAGAFARKSSIHPAPDHSGPAGRVSIYQARTAVKPGKATEYPLDVKDDSELCEVAHDDLGTEHCLGPT